MATRSHIAVVTALAINTACATTSTIHTDPVGSQIYINGKRCAESPCIYHSRYGFPQRVRVQIYRAGYRPAEFFVDTEAPLISYALFGVGSYLFHTFEKEYRFELAAVEESAQTPPPPAPSPPAPPRSDSPAPWPGDAGAGNLIEQCLYWKDQSSTNPTDERFFDRSRAQDCERAAELAEMALTRGEHSPSLAAALILYAEAAPEAVAIPDALLPGLCESAVIEFARRMGGAPDRRFPALDKRCPEQARRLEIP